MIMEIISAVILGIVQGITEFLPVSSSGHLVIIESLGSFLNKPGILFEVVLHFGTLTAVLIYFRNSLKDYLNINSLILLIIGTLPAVFVGLLFKNQIEGFFDNVKLVGFALMVTALINLATDYFANKNKKLSVMPKNALLIGISQAFAIIPGISRSGSTIFAAVAGGVDRKKAAEFSFILSVPAILGANFLEIISNESSFKASIIPLAFGFLAAMISGYFAIKTVISFLEKRHFRYFSIYLLVVGLLVILLN